MVEGPSTRYSTASSNSAAGGPEPTLSTEVDDPSHPLFHHRRIVTDFDYGEILGEGSYSTVEYIFHFDTTRFNNSSFFL